MHGCFFQVEALLPVKNAWLSPIFFWGLISLAKILFSLVVVNAQEYVGTVLTKSAFLLPSRDVQDVCAVAKKTPLTIFNNFPW